MYKGSSHLTIYQAKNNLIHNHCFTLLFLYTSCSMQWGKYWRSNVPNSSGAGNDVQTPRKYDRSVAFWVHDVD